MHAIDSDASYATDPDVLASPGWASVDGIKANVPPLLALASVFLCASCQDPDFGTGPITLSPGTKASFEEYMARDAPLYFVVTENGRGSYYIYCEGGFNCTSSAAQMQVMDGCHSHNPGQSCKVYAVGHSVVWQDADAGAKDTATMPAAALQLSASDRLIRECLQGHTPSNRIDQCSQAIAAFELTEAQKRGPFYVRGRAYEQIGNLPQAEQDYRAVLRIDPDNVAARARLDGLLAPAAAPD